MFKNLSNILKKGEKGLSLIELAGIIVISLILIAAGFFAANFLTDRAKETQLKTQLNTMDVVLKNYFSDFGYLPSKSGTADFTLIKNGVSLVAPNVDELVSNGYADINIIAGTLDEDKAAMSDPFGVEYQVFYINEPDSSAASREFGELVVVSAGKDGKLDVDYTDRANFYDDTTKAVDYSLLSDDYVLHAIVKSGRVNTTMYPLTLN